MITVTRLNGKPIVVNAELVRSVEENPDTTITLINGDHIIVQERMAAVVEKVLTLSQDMGGTMEYCHGVGVKLNHLLAREMGAGHDVVRRIKQALDPANIMNPGKLGL